MELIPASPPISGCSLVVWLTGVSTSNPDSVSDSIELQQRNPMVVGGIISYAAREVIDFVAPGLSSI